jgi:hypothetical protein
MTQSWKGQQMLPMTHLNSEGPCLEKFQVWSFAVKVRLFFKKKQECISAEEYMACGK